MEYYWNIHSINLECILNESLIFLVSIDILSLYICCSLLADIGERLCLYCVNICAEIVANDVK